MPTPKAALSSRAGCLALSFALSLAGLACGSRSESDESADGAEVTPTASASASKVLPAADEDEAPADEGPAPKAAETEIVEIPAGSFVAGSTPGDQDRNPTLEPALWSVELGAYDIDRFLYPNEPGKKPKLGVSRDEAAALCRARGRRLCTDLEWERACKGPDETTYPGHRTWSPACAETYEGCASGFGVLGMSARAKEWTADEVEAVEKVIKHGGASTRGATADEGSTAHRCARRTVTPPDEDAKDIGFRCCGGPTNALTIPMPKWQQTYEREPMEIDALSELLKSVPQLGKLEGDVQLFDEEKAKSIVLVRAELEDDPKGYVLTTQPLLWNPVPGERILLFAGRVGDDGFIVAYHLLPEGRYRLGSSLILDDDPGPIVLAFDGSVRHWLRWATCWQCPAESGRITFRDGTRVVITQE